MSTSSIRRMAVARRKLFSAVDGWKNDSPFVVIQNNALFSIPKKYPFTCQLLTATVKTSAADVVVQTIVEKKRLSELDLRRNFIFVFFGLTYLGGFQWYLLINKYRQWFPSMDRFGKAT